MKKFLLIVGVLFVALTIPAAVNMSQASSQQFQVREVEKTRANVPGFMIYPREFGDNVTLQEYDHDTESSRVRDWNICPSPSQAYIAADWLNVDPQYVTALDEPNAFAVNLPEPMWVKVDFGRLQYMENAEIVSPDSLVRSYEIKLQSATWRCISKHDKSFPLRPMNNITFEAASTLSTESAMDTVRKMCDGCPATISPLVEENGNTNPSGAVIEPDGTSYEFEIPSGWSWDDAKGHHKGPSRALIASATIRKN